VLTVEEDDSLHANNAGGDFLDFLDKRNTQSYPGFGPLEGILRIDGHMHNRNLLRQGPQEDNNTYRVCALPPLIKCEKRLSFVGADFDNQAISLLLNARMPELRKRIDDAFAHQVLPGIEEHQFFKRLAAVPRDFGCEDQIHGFSDPNQADRLDSTNRQRSPTDLMSAKSEALRLTL